MLAEFSGPLAICGPELHWRGVENDMEEEGNKKVHHHRYSTTTQLDPRHIS